MRSQKTIQMAETALMCAVLCVVSPLAIPVPMSPVPLSLATFAVYLTALILGARKGVACILLYLLLGMVGLPVFSGFSGGIGVLLGPTGGYLVGYLLCAVIVGWLANFRMFGKSFGKRQLVQNAVAMIFGTLACYALGTVWFLFTMDGSYTFRQAVLVCVVPYLVFDFVKILAAAAVAEPIGKIIRSCR